ncbi:MAG: GNVR domain-containing protein, partial [Flavobacteriaceae bacterium]|nr:GNVR domain-containing protein [Flavobacteriaceae bacterium]
MVEENFNDSENLREQIFAYLKYWPWFLLSVFAFLIAGYFYIRYAVTEYESTATAMVKDRRKGGSSGDLAIMEDMGLLVGFGSNSLDNEIEIFNSRRIFENVVKTLELNVQWFVEGNIKNTELYSQRPISVEKLILKDTTSYNVKKNYFIKIIDNQRFGIAEGAPENFKTQRFNSLVEYEELSFELTPSFASKITQEEFDKLKSNLYQLSIQNTHTAALSLKSRLNVGALNKNASIIRLSFRYPLKDKAEAILNELINQYNLDANNDRNISSKNTAQFIDERLMIISKELDSVEINKEEFKEENNLTDLTEEGRLYVTSAKEIFDKQVEIGTQLELITIVEKMLAGSEEYNVLPGNLGLQSENVTSLITNYNQLVLQRNLLLESATLQNPRVKLIDDQINQLKNSLMESLENIKRSIEVSNKELKKQENTLRGKIAQIPSKERVFRDITRQQNIKEALYLFLLQKREEASISLAINAPKAKVVDAAFTSAVPVAPKKNIILLSCFLLGLFVPFSVIYLRFLLDNKIRSRHDIESITKQITIVGEIPRVKNKQEERVIKHDRSVLSEAFRILRTNLQYYFINKKLSSNCKTILVTSSVKGEGKTQVSYNLGVTLANSGKRTLIVGADLRNPQLHRYFDKAMKERVGVTEYIIGKVAEIDHLIHPFDDIENLSIVF